MKITQQHYTELVTALAPLAPRIKADYAERLAQDAADPATRARWDALYYSRFMERNYSAIYGYLNDNAIDTALRAVMREIGLPEVSA